MRDTSNISDVKRSTVQHIKSAFEGRHPETLAQFPDLPDHLAGRRNVLQDEEEESINNRAI